MGYASALLELHHHQASKDGNAFIWIEPERVLEAAREADAKRERQESLGLLHGVPLAFKDNIDIQGTFTTACTPDLSIWPTVSAPVAESLLNAGAIVMGRTNMHELAQGVTSNNAYTGPVRNPYARQRSPGGSSGGDVDPGNRPMAMRSRHHGHVQPGTGAAAEPGRHQPLRFGAGDLVMFDVGLRCIAATSKPNDLLECLETRLSLHRRTLSLG